MLTQLECMLASWISFLSPAYSGFVRASWQVVLTEAKAERKLAQVTAKKDAESKEFQSKTKFMMS